MDTRQLIQAERQLVDDQLTRLRGELAELEQQIAALKRRRADLDTAEQVMEELESRYAPTGVTGDDLREAGVIPPHAHMKGELDDIIRSIILEKGRPMPRQEIAQELQERGLELESKNPGAMITMRLKRRGPTVFKNFDPQGWWPADVPCPLMGYEPETADVDLP
jgi:hypothetical protein